MKARGFSLLELIVALCLSSFVLLGIVGVAAQMIRFQGESASKGNVTGWTLMSLMQMNRELQNATVLYCPGPGCGGAASSSYLSGCGNYTFLINPPAGAALDASQPVSAFYYCVTPDNGPDDPPKLVRYSRASCPYLPAPSCGAGTYEVMARDFRPIGAIPYFQRANDVAGVELNYLVGDPTPTADRPNPSYLKVSTKIGMNKSYNNPAD